MAIHGTLVFVFECFGDVVSFLSFLEPVRKFYGVYKKKGTEGLELMPHVAELLIAMLWLLYVSETTGETLLALVNELGCVIQTTYVFIYVIYCPKEVRMNKLRLILLWNFVGFSLNTLVADFLKGAAARMTLFMVSATGADVVASGFIISKVIRTKSVEHLSHLIMLLVRVIAAIAWFFYGLEHKDWCVILLNVVVLLLRVVQMVLYARYRTNKPVKDEKLPEHKGEVTNEYEEEVINENKNVSHDHEKRETVTIEMGDQKKKLDEEQEKPQEGATLAPSRESWRPQEENWVKMNVDGAHSTTTHNSACGGLFRNPTGKFLKGSFYHMEDGDELSTEITNENEEEVINENKNVSHDREKHETVTIEMGDQKKKLDEEQEKPQEGATLAPSRESWRPQEENWVKVNVDGAHSTTTHNSACGDLFRNPTGKFLKGSFYHMEDGDELSTEITNENEEEVINENKNVSHDGDGVEAGVDGVASGKNAFPNVRDAIIISEGLHR